MTGRTLTRSLPASRVTATGLLTRVFALLAAAAAAEHGLGEVLQGNRAPDSPFIRSWPDAALFRIEGGEPALTLLPSLAAAGIVTLVLSGVLAWRAWEPKPGGRPDVAVLAVALLGVGGGFGPPVLALLLAAAVSLPLPRHPKPGTARAFGWTLLAAATAWLLLLPGLPLLDLFLGIGDAPLLPTIAIAFALFAFACYTARAATAPALVRPQKEPS